MENRLQEILKDLNDNRSKLSALFSLYNSSLLLAEESRAELSAYYEQMIDFKNEVSAISNQIATIKKKSDKVSTYNQHKSKITRLNNDAAAVHDSFKDNCTKYRIALKECGTLKSEYKQTVSNLCKEFKASINEETDSMIIKGYKQQVKVIKAILEKIEMLISDYNVKKNKVEEDHDKFTVLYESVSSLIKELKGIA
ncbi:MAG: hypothetical protein E7351_01935 [Clostridiales bacterium]|nr:hypothetical protein [Clostridiales bacterium]